MSKKTKTENIILRSNPQLETILAEYCKDINAIPTQEGKRFFREWNTKVPAKLIRQCIFAGVFWATKHPEDIVIEGVPDE